MQTLSKSTFDKHPMKTKTIKKTKKIFFPGRKIRNFSTWRRQQKEIGEHVVMLWYTHTHTWIIERGSLLLGIVVRSHHQPMKTIRVSLSRLLKNWVLRLERAATTGGLSVCLGPVTSEHRLQWENILNIKRIKGFYAHMMALVIVTATINYISN